MDSFAALVRFQIDEEEERYLCPHHHLDIHTATCLCRPERGARGGERGRSRQRGRSPGRASRNRTGAAGGPPVEELSKRFANIRPLSSERLESDPPRYQDLGYETLSCEATPSERASNGFHLTAQATSLDCGFASNAVAMTPPSSSPAPVEEEDEEEEEVVWLRREEVNQEPLLKKSKSSSKSLAGSLNSKNYKPPRPLQYRNESFDEIVPADDQLVDDITTSFLSNGSGDNVPRRGILKRGGKSKGASRDKDQFARMVAKTCRREQSLALRKEIIVEWQTIATVIDRLLFWLFLLATIIAYLVILVFVPMTKPDFHKDMPSLHAFVRNSPHT